MKSNYIILASALLISVATFAQKDQLKAAEKSIKNGNSQEALITLQGAESLIASATDSEKAQFNFLKGNTLLDLANKNVDTGNNLSLAAKSYQDLIAIEKTSGKIKYSTQAATSINEIKSKLVNGAIADSNAKKYSEAAKKLDDAYLLDKKDTINLYYAADTHNLAKEYDTALIQYKDLLNLKYTGLATTYFATNKDTKKENSFNSKAERDLYVKTASYEKPRDEKITSRKPDILRSLAILLVNAEKNDEAKIALQEATLANPNDTYLILTQANLYYKLNDLVTYKKLITGVLEKSPNDPILIFNLGVVSRKTNQVEDAENYFKRTIEIDPNYIDAYLNLAEIKLSSDEKYVIERDKLGNTEKDNKRYAAIKIEQAKIYNSALPYMEKAYQLDPKNTDVARSLLSIYRALEMTEKAQELKSKM